MEARTASPTVNHADNPALTATEVPPYSLSPRASRNVGPATRIGTVRSRSPTLYTCIESLCRVYVVQMHGRACNDKGGSASYYVGGVFFFLQTTHHACMQIIKKETEEDSGSISTHPFKNDIKASVGCIGILPEVLDWYLQQPVLTCHLHAV